MKTATSTTPTVDLSATLASVSVVSAGRGPVAIRLTHFSTDPQSFWGTPGVDTLVLDTAGLPSAKFRLAEGTLAWDGDGSVTEEVRLRRIRTRRKARSN